MFKIHPNQPNFQAFMYPVYLQQQKCWEGIISVKNSISDIIHTRR